MKNVVNKTRNWFLTINQEAECFPHVLEYLANYDKCQYSAILHDKDNEEQPHYHVCIMFDNARTFEQIQKRFYGAHIEVMESKYKCFRYLIHLDDTDKFQYDINDVVQRGNNVQYYSTHDEYIKLDTESVLENIVNGTLCDIVDCVKLFGIKQCNTYKNLLKELIESRCIEKSYISNDEYFRLEIKYNDLQEHCEKLENAHLKNLLYVKELESINNSLMQQVKEYEKMIKERGLL